MHNHLITMEVNHEKEMSVIQVKQVQLIKSMESSHAKEISVIEVKHFDQMTVTLNTLDKMERSHIQKFQPKSDMKSHQQIISFPVC